MFNKYHLIFFNLLKYKYFKMQKYIRVTNNIKGEVVVNQIGAQIHSI